ncbi:hypothetical protein ACLI09_08615 [Flavobacterium sp. RHBU_24]|uniref:hypothetical protein n=1 Tax=Flavobacterium sp. RHBU_24 TaxID=3391185 RepID=UPI003985367D
MNKAHEIAKWKRLREAAAMTKAVALQQYETAARLESEADTALAELGAPKGPRRKVKHELSDAEKLRLTASMTKGATRQEANA